MAKRLKLENLVDLEIQLRRESECPSDEVAELYDVVFENLREQGLSRERETNIRRGLGI